MSFLSGIAEAVKRGAAAAGPNLLRNAADVVPGVVGSVIQSRAASSAARERERAQRDALAADEEARRSADARLTAARDQQVAAQAPYAAAGRSSIDTLAQLFQPGGELAQGFTQEFHAPTAEQVQAEPGYAFGLAEGEKARLRAASASGTLGSEATARAAIRYGQDYESTKYSDVYNRLKDEFQMTENTYRQNQTERYNRLMGLTGVGQNAAGATGNANASYGNAAAGLALSRGDAAGNAAVNIANIRAGRTAAGGNSFGSTLSNITRAAMPDDELTAALKRRLRGVSVAAPNTGVPSLNLNTPAQVYAGDLPALPPDTPGFDPWARMKDVYGAP